MLPNNAQKQYQQQAIALKILAICGFTLGIIGGGGAIYEIFRFFNRARHIPPRVIPAMGLILLNALLLIYLATKALKAGQAIRYEQHSNFLSIWWEHQHQLWKAILWLIAGLILFFLFILLIN
jgi:hypothetical protein